MYPTAPEPASPCRGICQLHGDTCVGCGRLLSEIAEWPLASPGRKTLICDEAAKRLSIIEAQSATQEKPP